MFRRALVAIICAVGVCAAAEARGNESAAADALFREGRKAMERGDWAEAVQRLAESQRMEAAPGTLLNLAIAEDKYGKLSSAWEHARAAMDQLAPSDERRKIASDLFESVDKRVPRLLLRVRKPLPESAQVRLDGVVLRAASFGIRLPVDPGLHQIAISAPAHMERVITVRVEQATTFDQEIEPGPQLYAVPSRNRREATPAQPPTRSAWPAVGWVAVAVGGASLAAGAVTGYLAIDRNRSLQGHCDGSQCDQAGVDAADQGRAFAAASTITTIGGAAVALAGLLLVVLTPDPKAGAPAAQAMGRAPTLSFAF
jgi:hypothetical protein